MNEKMKLRLKQMGVAGFLFFLGKGLLWLFFLGGVGKCAFQ
jgi:hypothetical protein